MESTLADMLAYRLSFLPPLPLQTTKTFRCYNNIEAFVAQRPHSQQQQLTFNPHLSRPAITQAAAAAKPRTAEPAPGRRRP